MGFAVGGFDFAGCAVVLASAGYPYWVAGGIPWRIMHGLRVVEQALQAFTLCPECQTKRDRKLRTCGDCGARYSSRATSAVRGSLEDELREMAAEDADDDGPEPVVITED